MMEHDIDNILDFATLVSTLWVIYMIRYKLKATYNEDLDNMPKYYMLVPCALLALVIYLHTYHSHLTKVMWAFCVYLEAIGVLPQLTMMQKTKVYESAGAYLFLLGSGYFWLPTVLIA
ncbi:putative ER lumen protein retaining receptor [Helianthus anomalus]